VVSKQADSDQRVVVGLEEEVGQHDVGQVHGVGSRHLPQLDVAHQHVHDETLPTRPLTLLAACSTNSISRAHVGIAYLASQKLSSSRSMEAFVVLFTLAAANASLNVSVPKRADSVVFGTKVMIAEVFVSSKCI
jgi:hypothetical protein